MAAYNGFYVFPEDMLAGKHTFDTDVFKVCLTNIKPDVAADEVFTDIVEITPQNNYTAGGLVVTTTLTRVDDKSFVFGATTIFDADGGPFGPFQYAVLYNNTDATKPLIAYWDRGTPLTLLDQETLTVIFNVSNGIFKVVQV